MLVLVFKFKYVSILWGMCTFLNHVIIFLLFLFICWKNYCYFQQEYIKRYEQVKTWIKTHTIYTNGTYQLLHYGSSIKKQSYYGSLCNIQSTNINTKTSFKIQKNNWWFARDWIVWSTKAKTVVWKQLEKDIPSHHHNKASSLVWFAKSIRKSSIYY